MNIIDAIINLVHNPVVRLVSYYQGRNRANNAGDALEEYIQDLFANTFNHAETSRLEKLSEVFSYLGNNSNPPDAMLRGGDAIEVKKIESKNAELALNSSYPKQILSASSPMISNACRTAEQWSKKDIIYTVGVVNENKLRHLCMVYGLDYCASDECYSRLKEKNGNGIGSIPGVDFSETKELGRINRVDPLGITYLRVRGMWGISNPWVVFSYIYERNPTKDFTFMCIINDTKWKQFGNTKELTGLSNQFPDLKIHNVRIKNPDNPAQMCDAKLITYSL